MAITFGSFGDIIAAVQVAYKLLEVLNAQRGAKREFRELIADLRLFHRFLDQLSHFWQTREQCPRLDNLLDLLQPVICESRGEISAFLERVIAKYGRSLTSPSRRNPKDVTKMLQWHVSERDEAARLQDKLRKSKEIILMVQSEANLIAEEVNRALVEEKISALMDAEAELVAKLDERLDDLQKKVEEQTDTLCRIYSLIGNVSSAIFPITSVAQNLPTLLARIYAEILAQGAVVRSLNPHAQHSALIEDPLGWTFPVQLDVIMSWNTIHSILLDRFTNRPGYQLVKQRRYVMRDDVNGMELRQSLPLNMVLRPGQRVNMCMVYFAAEQHMTACPKCKKTTLCASETDITCLNPKCRMEIQRVEEVLDTEELKDLIKTGTTATTATTATTRELDIDNCSRGGDCDEEVLDDLVPTSQDEDSPDIFKRIRYLSRWEYRKESRGKLLYTTGRYRWWLSTCIETETIRNALIHLLAFDILQDINGWIYESWKESWENCIFTSLLFVGTSIRESRPVLVIFSMQKKLRRRAWKIFREVDWVRAHPSLLLFTTCHSTFHKRAKFVHRAHISSLPVIRRRLPG